MALYPNLFGVNMDNMLQITSATPIWDIIERFRGSFYSKHSNWIEYVLEEELPFVEEAMNEFIKELGEIQSKDAKWEAKIFIGHPPFIQFYDPEREDWANYYDMEEIDRRYIDRRIDQWLESKNFSNVVGVDNNLLYDTDFHAWTNRQAALLRAGDLAAIDRENIAEEIEDIGKSLKRELESRLKVLFVHLLKWQYQPSHRGNGWRYSIEEQRAELEDYLKDNQSLTSRLPEAMERAYRYAINGATKETGLSKDVFPPSCPWSFEQVMDNDFFPDESEQNGHVASSDTPDNKKAPAVS